MACGASESSDIPDAPLNTSEAVPQTREREASVNPKQMLALLGAAVLAAGSFLDWVTIDSAFGSLGVKGMEGDGKLTLAAGGLSLVLFVLKSRGAAILGSLVAAAGGAVAIYNFSNVQRKLDDISSEFARATVGIGIYVCIAGAALALIGGLAWADEQSPKRGATRAGGVPLRSGSPLPPPPPPPSV